LISQIANTEENVLVFGETGVGKTLIIQHLYHISKRFGKPLIKISCADLIKDLLENNMLNCKQNPYIDHQFEKQPILEQARGGILVLDEIADIPLTILSKLLQIIEGDDYSQPDNLLKSSKAEVWIIAISTFNYDEATIRNNTNQDLYYKSFNTKIMVEPIRRRPEDIPHLISHYVKQYKKDLVGRNIKGPKASSIGRMIKYKWPGNVRELQNIIKRILIFGDNEEAFKYTIVPFDDGPTRFNKNLDRFY
jgi:two-component system response regulator AtoC